MTRKVIRLVACGFAPCRKPARWMVSAKCYPLGPLTPGMQPYIVTLTGADRQPVIICEAHVQNMPGRPAEFFKKEHRAVYDQMAQAELGAAFPGFNFDTAEWHFERFDHCEVLPGAFV